LAISEFSLEIEAKRRIQEKRKNSFILSSSFLNIACKPLFFKPSRMPVRIQRNKAPAQNLSPLKRVPRRHEQAWAKGESFWQLNRGHRVGNGPESWR
jgi:hypothetical protein